ncbi:hypothetical protein Clacol_010436 [Clathrus columnatus]|uniref:F-box domain-containing protein n=1 Tax=Clathrus columnatus TaxID=1419009 RepID=A0AAV5ANC9_9AGAM|nr:hypothetical protein Clacol_010436 [Clathrus columnatus]
MPYPEGLPLYTIWEEIVYFLDSTRDLFSLALTCHAFKELIIPDHLHYRNLCIDIRMTNVWEFLKSQPRLAKSVRSIKLSNRAKERLPPTLSGLTEKIRYHVPISHKDIALFKSAISHMPLLRECSWGQFGVISSAQLVDISDALTTSAPCLEGLYVNLFDLTSTMRHQHQIKRLSIWTLTSLKRVVLRSQFPSPDAIQMILSCPNIEDLYSQATSRLNTFPFYMMQQANWTKLRRLEFQPLFLSNVEEISMDISAIITSFFVRHSNIECLHFDVSSEIALSTLPPSSLPKLRSLSSHLELDVMTSLLSKSNMSGLVHLTCTVTQIDPNTLPHMDKLESLCLFGNGDGPDLIDPFLSKAPNLKKISLAIRESPILSEPSALECVRIKSSTKLWNKDAHDQYTELFLKYPQSKLTHIYIVSPLITGGDRDNVKVQIGTLCEKLSVLRGLKYVQVRPDYVELERNENGTYSGYNFISSKEAESSPSWGGFFSKLSH